MYFNYKLLKKILISLSLSSILVLPILTTISCQENNRRKNMEEDEIIAHIEIPKDSMIKYEEDKKTKKMMVDRMMRIPMPFNYGYIDETLNWDGDALDVVVYSQNKFEPGTILRAKIIGAIEMTDGGEIDTKIVVVHQDDYTIENIEKMADITEWLNQIVKKFFEEYKSWKPVNPIKVTGFKDKTWAVDEYKKSITLMNEYGHMEKDEFIEKMKIKYPEKFTS